MKQLYQGLGDLRNDMYDMEERLNLSLIRQFQLHQTEMRQMLENLISKDREKD
jgi:hypothetical protein